MPLGDKFKIDPSRRYTGLSGLQAAAGGEARRGGHRDAALFPPATRLRRRGRGQARLSGQADRGGCARMPDDCRGRQARDREEAGVPGGFPDPRRCEFPRGRRRRCTRAPSGRSSWRRRGIRGRAADAACRRRRRRNNCAVGITSCRSRATSLSSRASIRWTSRRGSSTPTRSPPAAPAATRCGRPTASTIISRSPTAFPDDLVLSFTCIQSIPMVKDEIRARVFGAVGVH